MQKTQDEAQLVLIELGKPPLAYIASGMEGHIFDIGGDKVAKVWHSNRREDLVQLQSFYETVSGLHLPFDTPVITEIHDSRLGTVSIERELQGTPMKDLVSSDEKLPPPFATDAIISVLAALRDHPIRDAQSTLPILGVTPSDEAMSDGSAGVLLEVVSHKVERYGDQLRRSVEDFDRIYDLTVQQVSQITGSGLHAVHGDLCPPNILLGPDLEVTAVLDWGFLSHFGDSSLDASIACGIYDMYGTYHRENDDFLVSECVNQQGYDRHQLLVYRALYAILTSNAYSEDGADGHYAWCIDILNRPDVREALSCVSEH